MLRAKLLSTIVLIILNIPYRNREKIFDKLNEYYIKKKEKLIIT